MATQPDRPAGGTSLSHQPDTRCHRCRVAAGSAAPQIGTQHDAITDGRAEGQPGRRHDHGQATAAATSPHSPTTGIGSGIIYDSNGFVLTNRHVVADATDVTVELNDGRTVDGTVYGVDTLTDLAIVKIDATDLPAAPIGDSGAASARTDGDRHRQPAWDVHQQRHIGRRLRARSLAGGHGPSRWPAAPPAQPDPDRRGDQPGQLAAVR